MYKWKILACLSLLWDYVLSSLFFSWVEMHKCSGKSYLDIYICTYVPRYMKLNRRIGHGSLSAWLPYRGCVTAVQFILFNFANYSPLIAMELKRSKEITCKWQNQRSETNKYVSWALLLKLQAAGINFEKLLGWIVFQNPNFNPFQSSSVLPIRAICCFCFVILTFL